MPFKRSENKLILTPVNFFKKFLGKNFWLFLLAIGILVGLGFLAPHLPLVFRYATYTLFYEILPHTKWLCILFGVVIDILIVITLGSLAITGLWLFFAPIWDFFEYILGLKTRIYMDEKGLEITNKKICWFHVN